MRESEAKSDDARYDGHTVVTEFQECCQGFWKLALMKYAMLVVTRMSYIGFL